MPEYEGYSISHNYNGSITLSYTPVVAGDYRISVECDGEMCIGFPVTCTVQQIGKDYITSYETGFTNIDGNTEDLPEYLEKPEQVRVNNDSSDNLAYLPLADPVPATVGPECTDVNPHCIYDPETIRDLPDDSKINLLQEVSSSASENTTNTQPQTSDIPTSNEPEPNSENLSSNSQAGSNSKDDHPADGLVDESAKEDVLDDKAADTEQMSPRRSKRQFKPTPKAKVMTKPMIKNAQSPVKTDNEDSSSTTAEKTRSMAIKMEPTSDQDSTNINVTKKLWSDSNPVAENLDVEKLKKLRKSLGECKALVGDKQDKLECAIVCCDIKFNSMDEMKKHIQEKHKNERIEQPARLPSTRNGGQRKRQAPQESGGNKKLQKLEHVNNVEDIVSTVDSNECPLCNAVFSTKGSVKIHIRRVHGKQKNADPPQKVTCPVCNKLCCNKYAMNLHMDRMHNQRGAYPCTHTGCGKVFNASKDLQRHLLCHDDNTDESSMFDICPLCGKSISRGNLKAHIQRMHEATPDQYKCEVEGCGKTFKIQEDLNRHGLIHQERTSYMCEECGKVFLKPQSVQQHIDAVHVSQKKISCTADGCPKVFPTMHKLKLHVKSVHEKKNSFPCSFEGCETVLSGKRALKIHEMVHEGYRWICTEDPDNCRIQYTQKHSLMRHIQDKHRVTEPTHECVQCHKKFKFKEGLRAHMHSHATVRQFQCMVCGKRFKTKTLLTGHLRIHNANKQYHCAHCDKRYPRKYRLIEHIGKAHPEVEEPILKEEDAVQEENPHEEYVLTEETIS